jgi:hypothetical protein
VPTLGEILAALRDVLRQHKSAATSDEPTDQGYRRAVVEALHDLKAEIKRQTPDDDKRDRRDQWKLRLEGLGLLIGAITMGAVIYYAYVAQEQLGTFQAAEGAILSVTIGDITDKGVQLVIANTGRRPSPEASMSAVVVRFTISGANVFAPFDVKRPRVADIAAAIPALKDQHVSFGSNIPIVFKPGDRARLDAGEHLIAISVRIAYDDGFGQTRRHVFCYHTSQINPKGWKICGGPITPGFLEGLRETP